MNLDCVIAILKTDPTVKNVKIGCRKGGAWFYCGPIEGWTEADRNLEKRFDEAFEREKGQFTESFRNVPDFSKYKRAVCGKEKPTEQGYLDWCLMRLDKIRHLGEIAKDRERKKRNRVPIGIREVQEVYPSIWDADCMNILIAGKDRGDYWDISEYQRGYKEEV